MCLKSYRRPFFITLLLVSASSVCIFFNHFVKKENVMVGTAQTKDQEINHNMSLSYKRVVRVDNVSCEKIIQGDSKEIVKGHKLMKESVRQVIPPQLYIEITRNCTNFKDVRGYIYKNNHVTEQEHSFSIAYSLLMYRDVEQAERLLRAIYRPQNFYCIHIDSKSSNATKEAMFLITKCFENVFLASRSLDVQWGKFSVLEPELICMEDLLNKSPRWKYFINLTGQEFPLKTNYELVRILQIYNGANDIESTVKRAKRDRWKHAGPPPHNITAVKGAVHIVVNRDFVDYALHHQVAKDLLEWVKKTDIPDETFFSTLNHNPELGIRGSYKGIPESDNTNTKPFLARSKRWFGGKCEGKFVRDICIFGIGDLTTLTKSPAMFANKFNLDFQYLALDCMEEWYFNRTIDENRRKYIMDFRFYEQLGFVKNKVL